MNEQERKVLQKLADSIRVISAEAVEKAASGHPGLPMGCAEIGAMLYTRHLRHHPKNPHWMGRDRFVLSAGHGSMFLYSLLHLSGYDLPMEQLMNFRQLHSMTPGHPEYGDAPGVETTTGPLGQGLACATGMAMAQKLLAARFGEELFDARIYVLAGDGDIMEGITSEAGSLAGHLGLDNLVIIYDSNDVSLDGPAEESISEKTAQRYEAYGFDVCTIDGHDFNEIHRALEKARDKREKPLLIIAKTIIGKGAPNKQGTSACHGSKLGAAELKALKESLNWPEESFHVPSEVRDYIESLQEKFAKYEEAWDAKVERMTRADPEKAKLWEIFLARRAPLHFDDEIWNMEIPAGKATRNHSQAVIGKVAELLPYFFSGSADLSVSDLSNITWSGSITRDDWTQRNFKFGVREFCMAAASYGMALHGMVLPLCATFLTFSDYMRNAIRVCSIMKQRVIFNFTHDSVFLGEDGPTHQPVEHYAALRAMPNLTFIRPCDENEVKAAWIVAIHNDGPVAFSLSRQNVASLGELTRSRAREGVARGAYVLYGKAGHACDVLICATGSEVAPALEAAKQLEAGGKTVRVVSMPCWSYFEKQEAAYRETVVGGEAGLRVAVESGVELGWHKYIGRDGLMIGINTFGHSAPEKELREVFGLTPEKIAERILASLPVEA